MNIFLPFILGSVLFYSREYFPVTSLLTAGLAVFFIIKHKSTGPSKSLITVLVLACGFFYAQLRFVPEPGLPDIIGKVLEIHAVPTGEEVVVSYGEPVFSRTVEVRDAADREGNPIHLTELRLLSPQPLSREKIYLLRGYVPPEAYNLNPGSIRGMIPFHAVEIMETGNSDEGIFGRAGGRLNGFLAKNLSQESSGFLMSIITGERTGLTRETRDAFNSTGLAHILSISGAHFGLLIFVLFRVFRLAMRALPERALVRMTLYATPSQVSAVLCAPFIISYFLISSGGAPALRAFIMIALFLIGLLIQRRGYWLNTLSLAAVIIILISPDALINLSFQLSFLAVLCIGAVSEYLKTEKEAVPKEGETPFLRRAIRSAYRLVYSSALISLAASAGTTPLAAYHFHYVSLISPLTNLVLTPVIGFIVLPFGLLSSFIYLLTGVFPFAVPLDTLTQTVLEAVKQAGLLGFADVKTPAFPAALLISFYLFLFSSVYLVLVNKKRGTLRDDGTEAPSLAASKYRPSVPLITGIALIMIYAAIQSIGRREISVTHLDVGQGDSAVVELPDGKTLVMDTGKNGYRTAAFLRYRGIRKIDAIAVSHGEYDHVGGLEHLLGDFNVAEVWDNGEVIYPEGLMDGVKHKVLSRGDTIEGKGYSIMVLHPYEGFYSLHSERGDKNNNSMVVKITGRKASFLFTGDIGTEGEEDAAHVGAQLKSTVLKVPHHGSRTSISERFLTETYPDIAVISVGRANSYGHPHAETLAALYNSTVFRTDRDGAVGFTERPDGGLDVRTWKEFGMKEAVTVSDEITNIKKLFSVW